MLKDRQYKCPVCGAPVDGDKCEYCGCVIYDFANIDFDNPSYIRLKLGSNYMTVKAIAVDSNISNYSDTVDITDIRGNKVKTIQVSNSMEIDLKLRVLTDHDGHLFTAITTDKPYREPWRDDVER